MASEAGLEAIRGREERWMFVRPPDRAQVKARYTVEVGRPGGALSGCPMYSLPLEVRRRLGRRAGVQLAPGVDYRSGRPPLSFGMGWHLLVEHSSTWAQLALAVRQLDESLRLDHLQRPDVHSDLPEEDGRMVLLVAADRRVSRVDPSVIEYRMELDEFAVEDLPVVRDSLPGAIRDLLGQWLPSKRLPSWFVRTAEETFRRRALAAKSPAQCPGGCAVCGFQAGKLGKGLERWIQCGSCLRWMHQYCIRSSVNKVRSTAERVSFDCGDCFELREARIRAYHGQAAAKEVEKPAARRGRPAKGTPGKVAAGLPGSELTQPEASTEPARPVPTRQSEKERGLQLTATIEPLSLLPASHSGPEAAVRPTVTMSIRPGALKGTKTIRPVIKTAPPSLSLGGPVAVSAPSAAPAGPSQIVSIQPASAAHVTATSVASMPANTAAAAATTAAAAPSVYASVDTAALAAGAPIAGSVALPISQLATVPAASMVIPASSLALLAGGGQIVVPWGHQVPSLAVGSGMPSRIGSFVTKSEDAAEMAAIQRVSVGATATPRSDQNQRQEEMRAAAEAAARAAAANAAAATIGSVRPAQPVVAALPAPKVPRPVPRSQLPNGVFDRQACAQTHCACGKNRAFGDRDLVHCSNCGDWMHTECAGLGASPSEAEKAGWLCPLCEPDTGNNCSVCMQSGEGFMSQLGPIRSCAVCGVKAHQVCSLPPVPTNDAAGRATAPSAGHAWICDPCREGVDPARLSCCLCSRRSRGQVFKRIRDEDWELLQGSEIVRAPHKRSDQAVDLRQYIKTPWVHAACALFMIGTHTDAKGQIGGLLELESVRWKYSCPMCRSREGAIVQCNHGHCGTMFHAMCARESGLPFQLSLVPDRRHADGLILKTSIYCRKHMGCYGGVWIRRQGRRAAAGQDQEEANKPGPHTVVAQRKKEAEAARLATVPIVEQQRPSRFNRESSCPF